MDAIEEFLSAETAGGVVDSTGCFTVSQEKALRKLADYQLPRTSAWVLKMIQAGVAGGGSSIRIRQERKSTSFSFSQAHFGTLEELSQIWREPQHQVTPAQAHLMVALRTVAFSRRRPVLVTHRTEGDSIESLFWNGSNLALKKALPGSLKGTLNRLKLESGEYRFHISASPLSPDRSIQRTSGVDDILAGEFKELVSYATVCPVPLSLDGRSLNHFGLEDVSVKKKPLLFSTCSAEKDELCLSLPSKFGVSDEPNPGVSSAFTVFRTGQRLPSEVCWIQHGVVASVTPLGHSHHSFSLQLFLPGDHLETDLTGLNLRFPDETYAPQMRYREMMKLVEVFGPGTPLRVELEKGDPLVPKWLLPSILFFAGFVGIGVTGGASLLAWPAAVMAARKTAQSSSDDPHVSSIEKRELDQLDCWLEEFAQSEKIAYQATEAER